MTGLADELIALERGIWEPGTRFDRAWIERVLHPGYRERGGFGRRYSRAEVVGQEPIAYSVEFAGWAVRELARGVALVTYDTELRLPEVIQRSRRSSLWVRGEPGWQLRFHQATPRM